MGILDDAIREHLDLKRQHGARDSELREIQDEALGAGDQPDPFAAGDLFGEPSGGGEEPTRLVESAGVEPVVPDEPVSPPDGLRQIPGQEQLPGNELDELSPEPPAQPQEAPESALSSEPAAPPEPALSEPAAPPEPEPPLEGAEPPAPSESLEELMAQEDEPEASAAPAPETVERPAESERERPLTPPETAEREPEPPAAEAEQPEVPAEPESSVPEPPPPPPDTGSEPPGRARGRIDVPTQEHPPPGDTGEGPPVTAAQPDELEQFDEGRPLEVAPIEDEAIEEAPAAEEGQAGGPQLYDFETDEEALDPSGLSRPASETDDDFEALGPAEEEDQYVEEEGPDAAEEPLDTDEPSTGTEEAPRVADEQESGEWPEGEEAYKGDTEDDLWFEKGPPQDFDFEE